VRGKDVKKEKTDSEAETETETETEIGVEIVGQEVGTENAAEIEEIETGEIGKGRYRSCTLMRYLSRIDLTSFQHQLIERCM